MKKKIRWGILALLSLVPMFPSTSHAANNSSVTFTANVNGYGQIYQMNDDGTNIHAVRSNTFNEEEATVSPDKSMIAFVSNMDGDNDIYVMDADGSNLKKITDNNVPDFAPAWSPDGKKIAFLTTTDGHNTTKLWITDIDGSNPVNATPKWSTVSSGDRPIRLYDIAFSPDGLKLAITAGYNVELAIVNIDGTGYVNFSDELIGQWHHVHKPQWSKDGSKILFSYETSEADVPGQEGDVMIATVKPDGTGYQEIYRTQKLEIGPAFYSPDENQIIFTQTVPGENYETDWNYTRQIFKINADGTNLQQLTNPPTNVLWVDDWK